MTTAARFMAADIAQRNPGRNDRLEIGSIDRKFEMRHIVVRFQLCAWCQKGD
jgi:hypothetical protein